MVLTIIIMEEIYKFTEKKKQKKRLISFYNYALVCQILM